VSKKLFAHYLKNKEEKKWKTDDRHQSQTLRDRRTDRTISDVMAETNSSTGDVFNRATTDFSRAATATDFNRATTVLRALMTDSAIARIAPATISPDEMTAKRRAATENFKHATENFSRAVVFFRKAADLSPGSRKSDHASYRKCK
jgi:hypothetical protein